MTPVDAGGERPARSFEEHRGHLIMSVTITDDRITGLYVLADPARLARLEVPAGGD